MIKKRLVLILGALVLTLLSLFLIWKYGLIRGQSIMMRTYRVPNQNAGNIKIIALADLHGELNEEDQIYLVQNVQSMKPDLIVYLGDMIGKSHSEDSSEVLVKLTRSLLNIAPICYVDGNHEKDVQSNNPIVYQRLNEELRKAGAVQLENEIVTLVLNKKDTGFEFLNADSTSYLEKHEGTIINLCGIVTHYSWTEEEHLLVNDLRNMHGINVLLCHYPESVIWYNAFDGGGLDFALCGHTHGGLIRIPLVGGVYAPEQGRWPLYDLGAYPVYTDTKWSDYGGKGDSEYLGTMIISGGLAGEHGIPRFNNPKEISVIEISANN